MHGKEEKFASFDYLLWCAYAMKNVMHFIERKKKENVQSRVRQGQKMFSEIMMLSKDLACRSLLHPTINGRGGRREKTSAQRRTSKCEVETRWNVGKTFWKRKRKEKKKAFV